MASVLKFALGLWLALLLNERLPFKAFIRAIVLLPWVVPTVLSAIAFWWIYDAQFSIISWALIKLGLITRPINFLGDPGTRAASVIAANVWRGIPFVAITLLAGPADHLALALRGGDARRRDELAALPLHHAAAADADHRGGDDLLGAVHLHRLPADLRADPRRAGQRDASDGDAVVPARASRAAQLGEGAAIAVAMIPFLLAAILFSYFGLQRRRWQQGGEGLTRWPTHTARPATATTDSSVGMSYLESLPRRVVTVYLPLAVFVFVLLFPFYWMAITAVEAERPS